MATRHEDDPFRVWFALFMFTAERIELARADLDGALKLPGAAPGVSLPLGRNGRADSR